MTFLRSRLFWIAAVVVVIAALLPFWLSAYLLGILTAAYYFGVFAMAWDLLFGFAGEVNFGPTFLIGLGAYTAAILNSQLRPADSGLRRSRRRSPPSSAGCCWRCRRLRLRGPYFGLVTLVAVLLLQNFIVIFARRHRRRDRHDRARRAVDRCRRELLVRAGIPGAVRGAAVRPVALGGRADPAGQRTGRGRRRRARLQRHQAQDRGVLRQRAVLGHRRRDADLLHGHRLGRYRGRYRHRACRSSSPPCSAGAAPSSARPWARCS